MDRGADRKKLLHKLPISITELVPGNQGEKIQQLWMVPIIL